MSGFSIEQLKFDPTAEADTHNVGAYVRSSDGTLITHTTEGGKEGLDVNIINPSIVVTATDLDIRDLAFATDSVDVSGSSVSITGDVNVTQGTSPWVVSATDLDIRDLAFATDKVDVSGSTVELGATTLAALETITVEQGTSPWVVSATDLDIRDLSALQDNIAIRDGANQLKVEADGSINVNADISVVNGHEKAEDAAHVSGDIGSYMLSVRQDTLASSTSANGDYQSFKTDSVGSLWTRVSQAAVPSHAAGASGQLTVTASATAIPTTALTNRKTIVVQNKDGKDPVTLGFTNAVVYGTGPVLSPGSSLTLEIEAGVTLYGICNTGETAIVSYIELA